MNLDVSPAEQDFRARARTWLAANAPSEPAPDDPEGAHEFELAWQARQHEGGWAGVAWPKEYGGLGLSLTEQLIWYEEYALAGAPPPRSTFVGLRHAGPTLILRGTEEQKAEHLPRILRGELTWCQGFSEPGAGSDLASLRTRGEIDGDDLVVTGQKIWTSYADVATYQELLVRTDQDAPKHKGITWVICDMRSPGIEVRPIKTLAGPSEFCEVFYDEVRVPLSNVVGEINDGWSVAMSTLSFERGTAFMAEQVALERKVEELCHVATEVVAPDGRRSAIEDDEFSRRLGKARAEVAALRAMTLAAVARSEGQAQPGPEASMIRVLFGELEQRIAQLAVEIVGPDGASAGMTAQRRSWTYEYLWSFQATIAAGSKDIQRNIIGERVLGLPR
jgi:alkylation response protein AidB-like acyl-CoA dehydrogenase